jgi:hypothetical protein
MEIEQALKWLIGKQINIKVAGSYVQYRITNYKEHPVYFRRYIITIFCSKVQLSNTIANNLGRKLETYFNIEVGSIIPVSSGRNTICYTISVRNDKSYCRG